MRTTKSSRRRVMVSKEPTPITGFACNPDESNQPGVIHTASIPPLSQSRQAILACEASYAARWIQGVPDIEGEPARRGTEIHDVIADYVCHLRSTGQSTDYDFIRALAKRASPEAGEILERFCESFIFDPQAVLDVERHITLDTDFNPVDPDGPVEYEGTLDLVTMASESECVIYDWKSYWAVIDADTFQGKFYSLLQFCTNPGLETVRFILFFVRYGASREITYTRADVPKLKELAKRERERQLRVHTLAMDELKASPGKQCTYCSIVASCPLSRVNPYLNLTPEQRLAHTVWLKEALAHNTAILRDVVTEQGPIECGDDAGSRLRAEFRPKTMHSYPIAQTLPILNSWRQSHPGDSYMLDGLCVSGLSSPLKAKKRMELAAQLGRVCETRAQTDFKIGIAKEADE